MKKLLEAKKEIGKVAKNAKNPHFKNSYADINALIEAVEPILLNHGLLLLQPIIENNVVTRIIDVESGEAIESILPLPLNLNPQQLGSAVTYFRRYTLQSLLSLQATDDDGNGTNPQTPPPLPQKKQMTDELFEKAKKSVESGKKTVEEIREVYQLSSTQVITLQNIERNAN